MTIRILLLFSSLMFQNDRETILIEQFILGMGKKIIIALTWGIMSRGFKLVFASHYKKCHLNYKNGVCMLSFFSLSLL